MHYWDRKLSCLVSYTAGNSSIGVGFQQRSGGGGGGGGGGTS